MYGWIWRRLPFGLPGKIAGSAALLMMVAAVLWFWIFPWLEPLLPFDDVRVESPAETVPGVPGPSASVPDDPFAVPYSTATNSRPSATATR